MPQRGQMAAPQQQDTEDQDDFERIYGDVDDDGDVEVMDLSDVDDKGSFTLIPVGTYDAEVVNIEYVKENSKGNPMLTVTLSITEEPYSGRRLRYYLNLNHPDPDTRANMLARLKRFLLRVDANFDLRNIRPKELGVDLAGKECRVKVNQQPFDGEKRNNVQDVLPPRENPDRFLPVS